MTVRAYFQDERERIESSGGAVMYWGTWRVDGQLAVSRAIGKWHLFIFTFFIVFIVLIIG